MASKQPKKAKLMSIIEQPGADNVRYAIERGPNPPKSFTPKGQMASAQRSNLRRSGVMAASAIATKGGDSKDVKIAVSAGGCLVTCIGAIAAATLAAVAVRR